MLEDSHGSSTQEPPLVPAMPWGVKERLVQEKTAIGFYLSGHLFDESSAEVRRFARTALADLIDNREPQLVAGIVTDLRFINGNRGKLALFRLDDKSEALEATCEESVFARSSLLKEDALLIVQCRMQQDRFSGGVRLNVQQLWDLPTARCRFGKYLLARITPDANNPTATALARLFKVHPPQRETTDDGDELLRGLPVRLHLTLPQPAGEPVTGTLLLGEAARFYPSDAALASWTALLPHKDAAQLVYE